ncbi:ArsR/SmtB family transcription factor [Pseudonocardia sp. H11422]|uniref:ArsR/SmtB family transcription factor n=1 Tax=Pseudonocardia sp. H11422 TaxID=2835866 RepID=UPI0027E31466|nr:helix-turn-helix domain-containing protein [Pseudonocardia sp. H11422]
MSERTEEPPGPDAGRDAGTVLAARRPTRRALLDRLAGHGAASATVLARKLPVSRQAVVQHLAVLDAAGLVRPHRHGREVRYLLRPGGLTTTAAWMTRLAAQWDARLAAIAAIAEDEPDTG